MYSGNQSTDDKNNHDNCSDDTVKVFENQGLLQAAFYEENSVFVYLVTIFFSVGLSFF